MHPLSEPGANREGTGLMTLAEALALLGVLVLAFSLRWHLIGARSLWLDEAYSLEVARRNLHDISVFLRGNDAHPIGYYALLSTWIRWFGTGLTAMRSLSLIFGMAAIVLTWLLGRRLFSPAVGVVAAALVGVNPFQIIASNEVRMYPMLTCLVLISTWLLWRACASPPRAGWWVAYGVSAALAAYTSYYAFFLFPAQALWVFLSHRSSRGIAGLALAAATALVLYIPWIPYVLTLPARFPWGWRVPIGLYYLPDLFTTQTFGGYLFDTATYHGFGNLAFKYQPVLLLPFLVLIGAGTFALGRINRPARSLVVLSWMSPMVLIVLVSLAIGHIAAYTRHLVFLQPLAALLVAGGIVHLRDALVAAPRGLVPLLGGLLVLTFVYPAVDDAQENPQYQYFSYSQAAKLVKEQYQPGDTILYFPDGTELAFRYYFNPPGIQLAIPVQHLRFTQAAVGPAIRLAAEYVAAHQSNRVWLIVSRPWPGDSVNALRRALSEKQFREGPVEDFNGVYVELLARPPAQLPR